MGLHICPVEISAALMVAEQGIPYIKASWCYHVTSARNKINEWKGCKNASQNTIKRQAEKATVE